MAKHTGARIFKCARPIIKAFYLKIEPVGIENLPDRPCIVAANHAQMNGPLACEFYFPGKHYSWCAAPMMYLKEVPAYAYQDFWSAKPRWSRWFYKGLSYLIAPLSVMLFNNAFTIPVYRDSRIMTTFRTTLARMDEGARIVIFPEENQPHNQIVYQFQEGFVDVARLYHRKTGQALEFVPMYIAPKLKKMYIGKPTAFRPDAPPADEKRRICTYLMDEITRMAEALPEHTVIPYPNISKKDYPKNLPPR